MTVLDLLLGRPLASDESRGEQIGSLVGIPIFGLDALSSAAYGPEAALTLLIPLGAVGISYIIPISMSIIVLLTIVYFSYRQTIQAYPGGGGSYTVARQNLGASAGLLAAAALMIDYVLVVAVGISAGVGALVSAVPRLQSWTLFLCLVILAIITLVNLRGVRETGLLFTVPTYLFVGCLLLVILLGILKTFASGGRPEPVAPLPRLPFVAAVPSLWLLLQAFASGCTAMTGVGSQQRSQSFSRACRSHSETHPHDNHRHSRRYAGGNRLPGSCVWDFSHESRATGVSEHTLDAAWRSRWPGNLLLCFDRVHPSGSCSFGKHGVCGFSALVPCHRAKQLSSTLLCDTKPQTRTLLRNLLADRTSRHSLGPLSRSDGSPDPAVCGRSLPRLHPLPGRNGESLETYPRQRGHAEHHCEWPRSTGHRRHRGRGPNRKVYARGVGNHASDPKSSHSHGRGAPPLSSSVSRNAQRRSS